MSLSNLTGLEKPATELINRVSDAVGGIAKPWHIKRVARAEAEAKKIAAIADLEITDLQQRAIKRMVLEEEKNQENIEAITAKAIPHLSADAKPEELDEDFVRYLFEKGKFVSNEEMQGVWAKILAGETNEAGSFSRRTMEIVAQMSRADAELFTRLCRSVWVIGSLCPLVKYDPEQDPDQNNYSLSFNDLRHLDAIGLITHNIESEYQRKGGKGRNAIVSYYECRVLVSFQQDEVAITVGKALLTSAGSELASIAGSSPSYAHFEETLQNFFNQGIHVSLLLEDKNSVLKMIGGA